MALSWLIDTSAAARLGQAAESQAWIDRIERGLVSISTPALLEAGWWAKSKADYRTLFEASALARMPRVSITERAELRALEVQAILAETSQHRGPKVPDLLIAAIAEQHGLTVLHVDRDFDIIANVTGQTVERLTIN